MVTILRRYQPVEDEVPNPTHFLLIGLINLSSARAASLNHQPSVGAVSVPLLPPPPTSQQTSHPSITICYSCTHSRLALLNCPGSKE